MIQLILHLLGDYVFQSHWMALNKTKSSVAAAAHAIAYSLPFLILKPSWTAFAVILVTHFFIDRFRLARYVCWVKNLCLSPYWGVDASLEGIIDSWRNGEVSDLTRKAEALKWENCKDTGGYPKETPFNVWFFLTTAADNTMHLLINYLALAYL